jgi:hypothetical protein
MSVIVEKPYRFVPPHHGNLWPTMIQRLRLVDFYLRHREGVVSYEVRNAQLLKASIDRKLGILLAPNHCRYADPLVLGWLSRAVGNHVYAMASWHLFNKSAFDAFAIPKMGGFSLYREGPDRQSLEVAIDAIVQARRPLIVFPEGTTNRTNDHLQPLLDGVTFIARTAAKRRAKNELGPVVVHPVGIKYVFRGDINRWADRALSALEQRLSWQTRSDRSILARIAAIAEGLLCLKEIQYLGRAQTGNLVQRRDALIETLLGDVEREFDCSERGTHVLNRVRTCRAKVMPVLLESLSDTDRANQLRRTIVRIDLAQKLVSYPADYLAKQPITETRILETIERMQEDFLGKPHLPTPLHAVIQVDAAIEVDPQRPPRGEEDPVLRQLRVQLTELLTNLSAESLVFQDSNSSSAAALSSPAKSRKSNSSTDGLLPAAAESQSPA